MGHTDTSQTLWREALALREDFADAHFNLGTSLYFDRRPDGAVPHLRRAVELSPDSSRYHNTAAAAHRDAGLLLQAVEFWQSATRIDPGYADAYFNAAYTLQYDLGDARAAIGYWEIARDQSPADADIILHGAQASLDLGRPADAIAWLRSFIERNPRHKRRRHVEAALDKIMDMEL